jgi:dienelactone hydrolase
MTLQLDTLDFSFESYACAERALAFKAKTRIEAETWQQDLRAKLVDLLGGFPKERVDLSPRVTETVEFPTYTRDRVFFQSRTNTTVFGYVLAPRRLRTPAPAVLCLHGHGRGVDDIVGIREDGKMRRRLGGYQKDFALQCVRRGYVVLAIEQFGFGHRRDARARAAGAATASCQPAAGAALLLGQTMIGWRVWDAMRALDYLTTRPEVDPDRVAVMGISGGGTTSFHTAALDERIKVAVVSGYFCTFRDSIFSLPHCIDNYVPGMLRYAEMYDLAGLIAPRSLFVETGLIRRAPATGNATAADSRRSELRRRQTKRRMNGTMAAT